MGFWTLLEVASMPILQVLIISMLGAIMATDYLNLLSADTRKSLNNIVFSVFTPALMFASLAKSVTLEDALSWWFMPINVGLTFLFGGILGWIAVKLIKPKPHLEGLIIATSSSGNLGNILLIIIPAFCSEDRSPFGDQATCSSMGLAYASFSMAVGGVYIWTYTYQLIKSSGARYKAAKASEEDALKEANKDLDADEKSNLLEAGEQGHVSVSVQGTESTEDALKEANKDLDADEKSNLLEAGEQGHVSVSVQGTESTEDDTENRNIVSQTSSFRSGEGNAPFGAKLCGFIYQMLKEFMSSPPTCIAILGFIVGSIKWLKDLIIGDNAPLHVIQDSAKLLGDGTIPCIIIILGGNLTQGLRQAKLQTLVVVAVICVRNILLPTIGIFVVKTANHFGWLPSDPLYHFVLMIQFTLPPAMNIGTMTQLFDVAQEECSILFLWTYLVAVVSLTAWSTVFMWILTRK